MMSSEERFRWLLSPEGRAEEARKSERLLAMMAETRATLATLWADQERIDREIAALRARYDAEEVAEAGDDHA